MPAARAVLCQCVIESAALSTQVPASRAADNVSLLLHTDMGPFRRGYGILPGALAAVNRGGFGEFSVPMVAVGHASENSPKPPRLTAARAPARMP